MFFGDLGLKIQFKLNWSKIHESIISEKNARLTPHLKKGTDIKDSILVYPKNYIS